MTPLPDILTAHLRKTHRALADSGSLLSAERIRYASAIFRHRFGAAALMAISDGRELLNRMHGGSDQDKRHSMVHWLEFLNNEEFPGRKFGSIRGGSSHKFGLFRRRGTGQWVDAGNNDITEDQAIALAFEQRRQICACCDYLENRPRQRKSSDDDVNDYIAGDFKHSIENFAPALCRSGWFHKYLCLCFPDEVDSLHSLAWQRGHLLRLLQKPPVAEDLYFCTGRYQELAEFFEWPLLHLADVLNTAFGKPRRYWRIGTDVDNGNVWSDMLEGGYAAIGWSDLDDLSGLAGSASRRFQLDEALLGYYPDQPRLRSRKAGEISNFIGIIAENDLIAGARGHQILGLGLVTGPYRYDPAPPEDAPHRRPVTWLATGELPSTSRGHMTTVCQLTDEQLILEFERILLERATEAALKAASSPEEEEESDLPEEPERVEELEGDETAETIPPPPGAPQAPPASLPLVYSHYPELLQAVIRERACIRLWPSLGWLDRSSLTDAERQYYALNLEFLAALNLQIVFLLDTLSPERFSRLGNLSGYRESIIGTVLGQPPLARGMLPGLSGLAVGVFELFRPGLEESSFREKSTRAWETLSHLSGENASPSLSALAEAALLADCASIHHLGRLSVDSFLVESALGFRQRPLWISHLHPEPSVPAALEPLMHRWKETTGPLLPERPHIAAYRALCECGTPASDPLAGYRERAKLSLPTEIARFYFAQARHDPSFQAVISDEPPFQVLSLFKIAEQHRCDGQPLHSPNAEPLPPAEPDPLWLAWFIESRYPLLQSMSAVLPHTSKGLPIA